MNDEEKEMYFGGHQPEDVDYEIIEVDNPTQDEDNHFTRKRKSVQFNALGESFKLNLEPNNKLLAPYATIVKRSGGDTMEAMSTNDNCHYIHKEGETVAALDMCDSSNVRGIVIKNKRSFEVTPLTLRLKRMLDLWKPGSNETDEERNGNSRESKSLNFEKRNIHFVKRMSDHHHAPKFDSILKQTLDGAFDDDIKVDTKVLEQNNDTKIVPNKRSGGKKVLETAVFLDTDAYKKFYSYFASIGKADPDTEVKRLVLSYMNGIQAIYLLPSLQQEIDISIVRMELWSHGDPYNNYQGDREPLLDSFCGWQKKANANKDSDPSHWDVALLVSGLNFYAVDGRGRKNGVTMGLARVGGMCTNAHNCVIGELGVTNSMGKPYPSAGFTAVFVMAHEIGHNLGMFHDNTAGCAKDGFIMSPSRGSKGESQWSSCSVDSLFKADLSCLDENSGAGSESLDLDAGVYPGEIWTANRQCQIFLLDQNAFMDHTTETYDKMCYSLKCRTPKREGYYRAGPALEGTACGTGLWCHGGKCVKNVKKPVENSQKAGRWSDWKKGACKSGCTVGSRGYQEKTRECQQSRLVHTVDGCRGPASGIDFCDDNAICSARKDTTSYASEYCNIFSNIVKNVKLSGEGVQVQHSNERLWQACAIYCKRSDTGGWYTPRLEV